ncbi:hypothetical protein OQZ33_17895 [Pedobacter sp. MC2016-05]|uniref:hypothetical protein n=1 Tax=Pedobacter sp. MC2016-05 TaxID=2994474 RepID=UPI00224572CF|nr:hypothetical protein [Pedobacter sp. MC2016-05]MCX2476211.1 hypothetical protein [Pedobacter sp. MC2016-05]
MQSVPGRKSKSKKILKIVGLSIIGLVIIIIGIEYMYKDSLESPMYKVQQYLTYSKEDWANYESMKRMQAETNTRPNMVDVLIEAPQSPVDTTMWTNAIKNKDFIPESVLEDINRYKKRDFSKLKIDQDKPSDDEAQQAIVRNYQNEVTSLLLKYKAHIKIGACYAAPLQKLDGDTEIARVTAMVSAFNKEHGNLGNIQAPLNVIYDFVKYQSDATTWHLADFSQIIPYDYVLNKKPW